MSSSFRLVLKGLLELHRLIKAGKDDSPEADIVRDALDAPLKTLNHVEKECARLVSEDLYSASEVVASIGTKNMIDPTLVSDFLSTQIHSFIRIRKAIDECDPVIRAAVLDMIEIYESDDATPDEKRAALYTIQDALFPDII